MEPRRVEDALELLRSEYLDMPKLSFTPGEVARILDIDPPTARALATGARRLALSGAHAGRAVHARRASRLT